MIVKFEKYNESILLSIAAGISILLFVRGILKNAVIKGSQKRMVGYINDILDKLKNKSKDMILFILDDSYVIDYKEIRIKIFKKDKLLVLSTDIGKIKHQLTNDEYEKLESEILNFDKNKI